MFNGIFSYFNRKSAQPSDVNIPSFIDADVGELQFIQGLGWIGSVFVDGAKVDVAFCSSGDIPNRAQKEHVLYWMTHWLGRREELGRFMTMQSKRWNATSLPIDWQRNGVPDFESLELSAFVQTDPLAPAKVTIYLGIPGDDYRQFFIQVENGAPCDCGFDDG